MTATLPLTTFWQSSGPTAWIVLWSILAALTLVLVVLLRTRWRDAKAWRKCAILSLWVHFLLALLATTVRIVSGSPGLGDDPPMRIRIVADLSTADDLVDQTPQAPQVDEVDEPLPEPPQPETFETEKPHEQETPPRDDVEPQVAESALESAVSPPPQDAAAEPTAPSVLQPPDLLEAPTSPLEVAAQEPADAAPSAEAPPKESTVNEDQPLPSTNVAEAGAPPSTADLTEPDDALSYEQVVQLPATNAEVDPTGPPPASASPRPPVPAAYADRFSESREQLVASRGGNARTEQAVKSALAWLAAAQSEDGRWNAARHGAGRERVVLGQNRNGAGAQADSGVAGLALLAFLGSGHTHQHGAYAQTVAGGLSYLRRVQARSGALHGQAQMFAQMYCHSMATFAAGEAYAITQDEALATMVQRATAYSLAMQHPRDGGWRYAAGQTGDTSQLGWQMMAIKSAELGGLEIPQTTWTGIEHFLQRVQRGARGGLAVYRPEEARPSPTMTAEALFCRLLISDRSTMGMDRASIDEALGLVMRQLPNQQNMNLYYWYYATLALHRVRDASPQWAEAWRQWNEALQTTLLSTQREDGSWPESTVWGGYGGRVYTTALAAMCLEVYYRYGGPAQPVGADLARRGRYPSTR